MIFFLSVMALLVCGFFVMTFFGLVMHWAIHQEWAGRFFKAHMVHHLKLYPVTDFLSDSYRNPPAKDNSVVTFLILFIPFMLIPVVLYVAHLIPLWALVCILAEFVVVGWLHDHIHDSFHLRHFFLKRYKWFRDLTDIHYQHHVEMQTNFGIFFFFWDRVFGTYRKPMQAFIE